MIVYNKCKGSKCSCVFSASVRQCNGSVFSANFRAMHLLGI